MDDEALLAPDPRRDDVGDDAVLAPDGWRRGVIGVLLGAVFGTVVHLCTRERR